MLVAAAHAGPVECDALGAARTLAEARIEEHRAPITHPELIPGLALASPRTGVDLRSALTDLCSHTASLSLVPSDVWQQAGWSAHTFLLTRSEQVGCTLFQRSIAISVAIADGAAPHYSLRSRLPVTRTPVGGCPTVPTWREEQVLADAEGPVRLVLATDLEGGQRQHSEVVVRRASREGWTEQVLAEPAPDRLLDGGDGPRFDLTERFENKWVVVHGDRSGTPGACEAVPGQTVWAWDATAHRWAAHTGRDALTLLASRGLWRLAGQPGWMLILMQEDEDDADKLAWRRRRLDRVSPQPLYTLSSAWFPGLNPGFLVVTPGPWATRAEAEAARSSGRKWRRGYVKRAWTPPDPCSEPTPRHAPEPDAPASGANHAEVSETPQSQ